MKNKRNGTCNRHDECMGRINDNINAMQIADAEIKGKLDGFMKTINDFVTAIRKDTYSKDGLIDRVGNHGFQVVLQWGILAGIIATIVILCLKKVI